MRREDLLEFARRDRHAVDQQRAAYWVELAQAAGAAALIAVADGLRREVRTRRPDWPTSADRMADLESHLRVAEALHRVRPELNH